MGGFPTDTKLDLLVLLCILPFRPFLITVGGWRDLFFYFFSKYIANEVDNLKEEIQRLIVYTMGYSLVKRR